MLDESIRERIQWKEPINITMEQWMLLLENKEIITEKDIQLLNLIYNCKGCMATATQLAQILNMPHYAPINSQVGHLGKRIVQTLNIQAPKRETGAGRWWHVPFWGMEAKEGFYWILRPELQEAMRVIQELVEKTSQTPQDTLSEKGSMKLISAPVLGEEEELKFEGSEGNEAEALPPLSEDNRTIRTKSADPEIESLYGKYKRGKLILQPQFQRLFVWDRTKASRLIESAILDVPLPIIYLSEETDGKELVIDGQQRLTSFFSFIDGTFPDGKPFKLTGLKVLDEKNNTSYKELGETLQDKIRYYQIRAITILYDSHPDLKFEIFERLNTGAAPLNDMELRNCIYHGEYMELLKQLAADPDFMRLLGLKRPDTRMHDIELVLRFAAFYHATYLKYQPPMKRFLNRDMEKFQHITKADADELRSAFKNSVQIVKSLFGESTFRRFYVGTPSNLNGNWETKQFNASLYDVLMGVFWNKDKTRVYAALDSLREGFIDLMVSDKDFIDAILIGTSEQGKVKKRFHLTESLVDDILQTYRRQPRCFSIELKKVLFTQDQTCALCHQHIKSLDDAAVDHIQQYWKGGKTIPENARLTHRYCNLSRSRNE